MRSAGGNRYAGRHHAIGPQHANGKIGNVHRATLALVVAGGATKQLTHHLCGIGAFGQRVTVAPVGRGQHVSAFQVMAHACGHGFLPGRQVQRPAYQGGFGRGRQAPGRHAALAGNFGGIFKLADPAHEPVQIKQAVRCHAVLQQEEKH